MNPVLYLVPVPIGDGVSAVELAPRIVQVVSSLRDFVVENEKTARRFMASIVPQDVIDRASFEILDEHTRPETLDSLLAPLRAGRSMAILSEAGSPCIADPGTNLVAAAARNGFASVPLPGPSSILMALMASGLGGQRFAFHGYLPPDQGGREAALRQLERRSAADGAAQLFIETPYRNDAIVTSAIQVLASETMFCAATGLSSSVERILVQPIGWWKENPVHIGKIPTVFVMAAATGHNYEEPSPRRDSPAKGGKSPRHTGDKRNAEGRHDKIDGYRKNQHKSRQNGYSDAHFGA